MSVNQEKVQANRVLVPVALLAATVSLLLGVAGSASAGGGATASATKTFAFTGGEQVFSVPDGVTSLDVTAVGGKGGVGVTTGASNPPGGFGAVATGKLAVTPGQILFIEVGGNGGSPQVFDGGFNGGGKGGSEGIPGGGGGGGTDIRTISTAGTGNSLTSRLLIAGGGGGGGGDGFPYTGGAGGGAGQPSLNGNGASGAGGSPPAGGQVYGGQGGAGGAQVDPTPGQGGSLGQGSNGYSVEGTFKGTGGGGAGGFFGGNGGVSGGGPNTYPPGGGGGGGGGGGSSHFASTVTDSSVQTDTTGVPLLRITYKAGGNKSGLKFGKVKLNKAKGTATLPVTVPGTGNLTVGGKGVVKKRPGFDARLLARKITEAGTYKLKVKAKGRKKAQLFGTGKVKVKAVVSFKPSSGDKVSDTKRIKLKKN